MWDISRSVRALSIIMVVILFSAPAFVMAKEREFKGPRKRIAVLEFEDKSGNQHAGWRDVGQGVADSLVTALVKTNRFIVIEREQIHQVMTEQAFGLSGAVNPDTAAKIGRLIGVSSIVKVDGNQILINTGVDDQRRPGDVLVVYRAGEVLTDPDTGESLGSQTEKIGRIEIVEVKDKRLSVAKPLEGSGFSRADIIKEK